MHGCLPDIRSAVRIDCQGLGSLIAALGRRGYEVIGPRLKDGAICYGPIEHLDDLPMGWTSEQGPASYHLKRRADAALFGFANGPNSLKDFIHPSQIKLFSVQTNGGSFNILPNTEPAPRYAFVGVRGCELAAVGLQDRVLLGGHACDPVYRARRDNAVIIAVQCSEPSNLCFCSSMGTGPRATSGYDLALTEIIGPGTHEFLIEIGSELGAELVSEIEFSDASGELQQQANDISQSAEAVMHRTLETQGLRELLRDNFDHPHWDDIARRCLACGNCTQVCPTCFCVTVEDSSDVAGEQAERWRKWDSCFTLAFSYIHGGSVRVSTKSRYRQWLSHKLSYWHDQFGSSGCVGCGRCIAWCPAGIDLTQEVAAIRAGSKSD
ncbi:MAG TPA: 4Fe-4S dicluster domain-containing protein [Bryobacteraceae bacterium]|nr:4Fe-4S dicluster domain-containing protein [Bryobacteraceae bacterium]